MDTSYGILGLLAVHIIWDWLKGRKNQPNPYGFLNIRDHHKEMVTKLNDIHDILIKIETLLGDRK